MLRNFEFYNTGHLRLYFSGNKTNLIKLDQNSGRVITRPKIDAWFDANINHTGIYLGIDVHSGREIIVHNHFRRKMAYVSTMQEFENGVEASWGGACTNHWQAVIVSALNQVKARRRYLPYSYNCQTFTNTACHNRAFSEDANRIGGQILGFLAFLFIGGLMLSE